LLLLAAPALLAVMFAASTASRSDKTRRDTTIDFGCELIWVPHSFL